MCFASASLTTTTLWSHSVQTRTEGNNWGRQLPQHLRHCSTKVASTNWQPTASFKKTGILTVVAFRCACPIRRSPPVPFSLYVYLNGYLSCPTLFSNRGSETGWAFDTWQKHVRRVPSVNAVGSNVAFACIRIPPTYILSALSMSAVARPADRKMAP